MTRRAATRALLGALSSGVELKNALEVARTASREKAVVRNMDAALSKLTVEHDDDAALDELALAPAGIAQMLRAAPSEQWAGVAKNLEASVRAEPSVRDRGLRRVLNTLPAIYLWLFVGGGVLITIAATLQIWVVPVFEKIAVDLGGGSAPAESPFNFGMLRWTLPGFVAWLAAGLSFMYQLLARKHRQHAWTPALLLWLFAGERAGLSVCACLSAFAQGRPHHRAWVAHIKRQLAEDTFPALYAASQHAKLFPSPVARVLALRFEDDDDFHPVVYAAQVARRAVGPPAPDAFIFLGFVMVALGAGWTTLTIFPQIFELGAGLL